MTGRRRRTIATCRSRRASSRMPSEVEKVAACCSRRKIRSSSPSSPAAIRRRSRRWSSLPTCLAIPVMWGRVANFANFPTDHPLYLGVATYEHLKDADLILLVGGRAPWYPPHTKPTKGKIVSINENQFKGHMIYQQLHADAYLEGDIAAALQALTKAARAAKIDADAVKKRREHWTERARRLRRRPEGRKGQGQRQRQGDRSAGADRHARRSHAGRHDLRGRDHPARPDAAPASALHHAAKFLPRLRRPRPGHRHRARRQARGAPSGRSRC